MKKNVYNILIICTIVVVFGCASFYILALPISFFAYIFGYSDSPSYFSALLRIASNYSFIHILFFISIIILPILIRLRNKASN